MKGQVRLDVHHFLDGKVLFVHPTNPNLLYKYGSVSVQTKCV